MNKLKISPDHRGINECWIAEADLTFSIAEDGLMVCEAYCEDGMPAKGSVQLTKEQMKTLGLFLIDNS